MVNAIQCESMFLETSNNMKLALIILAVLPCMKALDLTPNKVKDASRGGKGIKKVWMSSDSTVISSK